jgi:hypothetical protein
MVFGGLQVDQLSWTMVWFIVFFFWMWLLRSPSGTGHGAER